MKLKQYILTAAMLMAAAVPMQSQAATATATMQVTTTVVAPTGTIMINGPVDFGTTLTTSSGVSPAMTTMTVQVTNGVNYTIGLDQGTINAFNPGNRMLYSGFPGTSPGLSYNLYSDSGHTVKWGDGSPNLLNVVSGVGSGSPQTLTIYAAQPMQIGNINIPAGTYTDTVTATLTY